MNKNETVKKPENSFWIQVLSSRAYKVYCWKHAPEESTQVRDPRGLDAECEYDGCEETA
jgi:hypothetical protein